VGTGLRRASAAAKATRVRAVWCVRHRDGWCATKTGKPHQEDATSVPTRCGHHVVLPMGSTRHVPTCVECIETMKG
jgi:hypothetical protein